MPLRYWLTIHLNKVFIGKKKKINVLTIFFISHKSSIKTFLKGLLTNANECLNNLFKESFHFYKLKWQNFHQFLIYVQVNNFEGEK